MTRRCGISSSPPLAALALLLLLCISHCAAAARLFPASTVPHQDTGVINIKAADAASDGLAAALPAEGSKVRNGEEAVSSEVTTAAEEEDSSEEACEEGINGEECMQRRLLHDAHLDYIYTQRKGRP